MAFIQAQLTAPTGLEVRVVEFHLPGGLRSIMSAKPKYDEEPYFWPDPPYYERYIYGSGDYGKTWTEVTNTKTHIPFTITPLDSGIDAVLDAIYCGGSKVIGRALDTTPTTKFLRLESNDAGVNWSMKDESALLTISGTLNQYLDNSQTDMCYAGDGEIYTLRPKAESANGNMIQANVYKSTDYGDVVWTKEDVINGWNCRGLYYIGKWEEPGYRQGRKRFLCVADFDQDGKFDSSGQDSAQYTGVMRSDNNGKEWFLQQMLPPNLYNNPHGQSSNGWQSKSKFAYLGDGVVLLLSDTSGDELWFSDAAVYKSTDYGSTWAEIARIPKSPYLKSYLGDPVPDSQATDQHSLGIWYLGKQRDERYHVSSYRAYKTVVYAWVATSFSLTLGNPNHNLRDQWISEDGGTTWKNTTTIPSMIDTTTPATTLPAQVWWQDAGFYVGDNGAIPGLYD